jgi:SAM-dependent methyltransferase
MDENFWDDRYRSSDALWSGNPNPHLVSEVSGMEPGTALDVGCGEGAGAAWLAERGWQVTALDISAVALERAAAFAEAAGAEIASRITWLHADLTRWEPAPASYDLVSAQFMHLPPEQRDQVYRRLAESVAPGGTLLVVGHHHSDLQTTVPRCGAHDLFFTSGEIAAMLDPEEWDIVISEARERQTVDPDGQQVTIRDAILRAQRRM